MRQHLDEGFRRRVRKPVLVLRMHTVFALTVALATSNSFLIPTHQVNALIMGPGGYRVADFMRAGGIMTILFLVVLITVMNLVF